MTIEPETKSWTWVLGRPCDECGLDTQAFPREEIGRMSRQAGEPWAAFLSHPLVRQRPTQDCWSALEYGCHVRDVFRLGIYRLQRMLQEDNPQFDNWDQDETAVSERYDLQDPATVGADLLAAAHGMGDLYDTVAPDQWQRPSLRSDGSPFTVESFGRYMVHDPVHHVVDVRHGFELLNGVS